MNRDELDNILELHTKWIHGCPEGIQADLRRVDLRGADLRKVDLRGAELSRVDLRGADLRGADLRRVYLGDADLRKVDLSGADLRKADLRGADLRGAELRGAELSRVDLRGAELSRVDLSRADLSHAFIYFPFACPDEGSFVGWKKAGNKIIKLLIPEDAIRSSATGRKCRCDKAVVLEIQNTDGTVSELRSVSSDYDGDFIYEIGETVIEPKFDANRWNECAKGIHFFITRQEAVNY